MTSPRWLRALMHPSRFIEVMRAVLIFRESHRLIACYLHLREPAYPFVLQSRDGYRLEITSYHDAVTAWVIFCREEYGMPGTARTILDIGANYGAFSLWASRYSPTARIVALEPFPKCYERLVSHVQMNRLSERIETWNVGLGRDTQDRYLGVNEGEDDRLPSQSRAFVGEECGGTASVKISILSMTDLVTRACEALACDEIDFVKLDVEGVEHAAITPDAIRSLQRIRHLSLEYHPNGSKAALFDCLAKAGLHCVVDLAVAENSGVAHFIREPAQLSGSGSSTEAIR